MNKPIPHEVAMRLTYVLADVMNELRALHEVSLGADELESADTFPLLTGAVCEHAHVLLDRCAVELGATRTGVFDLDARFSGAVLTLSGEDAANG